MGKLDEFGNAVRVLAKSADEPLDLWPPTDEQILRWAERLDAPKPKQTIDRMNEVIAKRGLQPAGTIREIEKALINTPSSAAGPGGIDAGRWIRMLGGFPKSPGSTPVYVVDPVQAVASQYPIELRQQAIETARRFQMPTNEGGARLFQAALAQQNPQAVVLAYPRRRVVEQGAAGLAHFGARTDAPGLVEVAAGRPNSPEFFDRTLLHELRHTLEGDGLWGRYRYGGYQDWTTPKALGVGPAKKEYLSRTGEEVARFGDARARYALHAGKLISDPDEAERAAELILDNRFGLGGGFYAPERVFYKAAREADPNIRAHQNRLLQGLLSVPAVMALDSADE